MKKTFLEVSVSSNERQRDLLVSTMIELGCLGFQDTDSHLFCYFDKSTWIEDESGTFRSGLKTILQTMSANADIQFREIEEENWNELWEKTVHPIEVGRKLVIKPSWCPYDNVDNRLVIQIDPKMSFGTGYHESTRLTLQFLEKYTKPGCSIFDVGTGTGILAIAAVKLGAQCGVGIDNDEWAIANAQENVTANGLAHEITISSAPVSDIQSTFDLVTANLSFTTIFELLNELRQRLHDRGILLLSGLLDTDQKEISRHLELNGFEIVDQLSENEWIALAARKKS
ncbi:MAG: 50S ribosomal protein L11 methyltransferase [Bacteroidota bacterium]|jgi:ribosomal protein L11 methyltransferase